MAINTTASVAKSVAKSALAAIEEHPLQREAVGWTYCPTDVFEISTAFVDHTRIAEDEEERIRALLADAETVLVVSYWTSDKKPEPLSGAGKQYGFLLHRKSLVVLHADVDTWRS